MTIDARLTALAAALPPIASLFDAEPGRLAALSFDVAGVHFDFAKLSVSADVFAALHDLAVETGVAGWRTKLFDGAIVNSSERRAATHVAERGMGNAVDNAAAAAGQDAIRAMVEALRSEDVSDIIHIGIGGSALGPALLVDALGRDGDGPAIHIVANIDGEALARALAVCDPRRTRIIIVSKTFGTTETMTNADTTLAWLAAAGVADPRGRCIAVTAAPAKAQAWGAGAVLPFAETVGGRYSLWSAVGLPLALRCGWAVWAALHAGAAAMDAHFRDAPAAANVPLLAGLCDVAGGGRRRRSSRPLHRGDRCPSQGAGLGRRCGTAFCRNGGRALFALVCRWSAAGIALRLGGMGGTSCRRGCHGCAFP